MKEGTNKQKISEQKKREYDDARRTHMKQLREKRDRLEKEGREEEKTLYFIDAILKEMNLSWTEFGRKAGFSNQLVSWWQTSDNMKLSNVMDCFAARGIAISPEFADIPGAGEVKFDMVADKFEIHSAIPLKTRNTDSAEYVETCYRDRRKRMWFLANLVKKSGESGRQFAIKAGISPSVFIRYFRGDDIMVRAIYNIADTFGKKVTWRLEQIQDAGDK